MKKGEDQSIFRDPTMAAEVDFQSEFGFSKAAGKKAKKAAKAASKWNDDEDETPKKDEGDGGDGGDKDSGDVGAGGDGDKKDDASKDGGGDAPAEDAWDSFMPAKGKKKAGKKGKVEEVAPPAAEKFDAFHEIKLDDTGPMLDLSFDTGTTKPATGGFGTWGSSWNTGTTTTR